MYIPKEKNLQNYTNKGSPTLVEENGRESSTPVDHTDENSITSADTVKVIIDPGRKELSLTTFLII